MYMNILFNGGCVWGMFEYIGAIQYIKSNNIQIDKLYGVSSGSVIALCVLLDIDIQEFTRFMESTVQKTKFQSLTEMQLLGVKYVFDTRPDAYKLANDRLFVGITDADGFRFKSNFSSNAELANTMICGGTIPLFSSYNSVCDGRCTIDGGASFTSIHIPKDTIVIRPTTLFPISAIPPPDFIQQILIQLGYMCTEHYIRTKNKKIGEMWYTNHEYLPLWLFMAENRNKLTTVPRT